MEIFHEIMRIYLVSFLFFLIHFELQREESLEDFAMLENGRSAWKKSSVNVSRNFFPLLFYLISGYMNLFFEIFLLFPSWNINELEQQECEEKNRNRNANVAKECRVSIWRERKREIDTRQEREREKAFPYRIKHLVK